MIPDNVGGSLLLYLQFTDAEWLHRRVERVDFLDDNRCRYRVSLDVNLSDSAVLGGSKFLEDRPRFLVPLGLLAKRPLTGFDLRDEVGASLSLLTSSETAEAAYQVLLHLCSKILGHQPTDGTKRLLRTVVSSRPSEAHASLRDWRAGQLPEVEKLTCQPVFMAVICEFADNFLALTLMEDATRRQVFKYAYVEELPWSRPRFLDRLLGTSSRFTFPVTAAGAGYSYHFEVAAPAALDVRRLVLTRAKGNPLVPVEGERPQMRAEGRSEQMHVHMSRAGRYTDYVAVVDLVPQRRGLVRSAFLGATYATVVLVAGFLLQVKTQRLEDADAGASGAALLLVPALAAAYVTRPGEHGLAARFAFGTRVATVVAAGAAVAASVTLALDVKGTALSVTWAILGTCALLPTLYLGLVYYRAGQSVDFAVEYQ